MQNHNHIMLFIYTCSLSDKNAKKQYVVLVLVLSDLLPTSTKIVSAGPTCTHHWKKDFGFKINESVRYDIYDHNYEEVITT